MSAIAGYDVFVIKSQKPKTKNQKPIALFRPTTWYGETVLRV
jgi:hypothetical protein